MAVLQVRVAPRSSRSKVCGRYGEGIKVSLNAPPVDGRANKELAVVLAGWLGVAKSNVSLLSGERGREKRVEIQGVSPGALKEAMQSLPDA